MLVSKKARKDIIRYKGYIGCVHEDIDYMGEKEPCEVECEWEQEHDCSEECPEYKARDIEICMKHNREYVGRCGVCDAEYWTRCGYALDRERAIENMLRFKFHLMLKYGHMNYWGGWGNERVFPKISHIWKSDSKGKKWFHGFQLEMFKHCLIAGFWIKTFKAKWDYEMSFREVFRAVVRSYQPVDCSSEYEEGDSDEYGSMENSI